MTDTTSTSEESTAQQWWSARECATHCGIALSTWRDYVSDERAPAPAATRDL